MSAAAQKRILEDLLAKGVAGVSISPVNPDNSTEILNQVASKAALFTQDADAPQSQARHVYRHRQRGGRPSGRRIDEEGAAEWRQGHAVRRDDGRRKCARAHPGHQGSDRRAPRSRSSTCARTAATQTKAKANVEDTLDQVSEHRSACRSVGLQHAADLQCREGGGQGGQGQDRRLRRGPADPQGRLRRCRSTARWCSSLSSSAISP